MCIPECRGTFLGPFRLAEYVRGCLEDSAALENWQKAHNRLHVAVTSLPSCKSMRVSQFESKEDLITALLASAAAVPLAPPVKCKGQWLIDGGIADFQPVLDDATVTISPLYFSRADIKPSRYVPAWWAFLPPSNSATVDWLYDLVSTTNTQVAIAHSYGSSAVVRAVAAAAAAALGVVIPSRGQSSSCASTQGVAQMTA